MSPRKKELGKKARYLQNIHLTAYFVKKLTKFILVFSILREIVNFLSITLSDFRRLKEDKSAVFHFTSTLLSRYY